MFIYPSIVENTFDLLFVYTSQKIMRIEQNWSLFQLKLVSPLKVYKIMNSFLI